MGTWSPAKENDPVGYIPVRAPPPPPPPPPHICIAPQKSWFPWIVPLIFVVDVLAFVFTMYVNNCPSTTGGCLFPNLGRYSFQPFDENPFLGPSTATLEKVGALKVDMVVEEGQVWRLISCIWLHAGVVHLLANMISLLFVGVRLEMEFGFWKIGLLYIISGFGGSLASSCNLKILKDQKVPANASVGASGALFGLLGAMLSELIMNWTIYANKFAALLTLICVIALNMAVGLLPQVDMSAHVGGFLTGFLLGFILLIRPQFGWVSRKHIPPGYESQFVKSKHKCYQYVLWVMAFVILIIGFAVALVRLFFGYEKYIRPFLSRTGEH